MNAVPWLTLVAAVIAALASLIGALLQWRGAHEATVVAEFRAKREEVMRTMRWAAEMAASSDADRSRIGVEQLEALYASPILDQDVYPLIDAALGAVVDRTAESIDEIGMVATRLASCHRQISAVAWEHHTPRSTTMGETKTVVVTPAQVKAAQILVRRAKEAGKPVRPAYLAIANAEPASKAS